jgi:ribosomal protein S18 acetylase RimI-like enzyme
VTAGGPVPGAAWPPAPADSRIVTDPDELAGFFGDRPVVHIYALADLDEPFWSGSRWYRRGDAVVGLVGLPDGEGLAGYAVATRDPDGTLALLAELAPSLPAGLLVTGPVGLADRLGTVRPLAWAGPHERYELDADVTLPTPDPDVEPLGPTDADELVDLYGRVPGAAFVLRHMLDDETFVGVRVDGRVVAAAGTHVVAGRHRTAAVGAVFTDPDHRGRGYGRAVTVGVLHRLRGRVDTVGLNVASDNTTARRIYESLGFRPIQPYEEAELA